MSLTRTLWPFLLVGALLLMACAPTQAPSSCLGLAAPDGYRMRARLFLENSERDSAALYYQKAIAEDSTHVKALGEYAQLLFRGDDQGNTDTAEYDRVLDLYVRASHFERAGVLLRLQLYAQQKKYAKGVALLLQVYDSMPSTMDWSQIKADLCHVSVVEGFNGEESPSGHCQAYLEELEAYAEKNPAEARAWKVLMQIQERAGLDSAACHNQGRIWALDTTRLEELYSWAACQYRTHGLKEEPSSLRLLLERPDVDARIYASGLLSEWALIQQDSLLALKYLQARADLEPLSEETMLALASLHGAMDHRVEQHAILDSGLARLKEDAAPVSLWLAKVQAYQQEAQDKPTAKARALFRQALPYMQKLLQEDSSDASLWSSLGYVYSQADSLEQGVACLEKAVGLDSAEAAYKNNLAFVLMEAGRDLPRAMGLVDSALLLQPGFAAYEETRAWGLYRMGKNQEALEALEALEERGLESLEEQGVLRLDLWEHLAEVTSTLGQADRGRRYWQRILRIDPGHERAKNAIGGGS